MARWMPPQWVQRIVQYSDPALPPITRSTVSSPSHSGQLDSTERAYMRASGCDSSILVGKKAGSSLVTALSRNSSVAFGPPAEAVDMVLGIGNRRVGVGPGEAELHGRKQLAVDGNGAEIGAADAGMPEVLARLERFDVIAVVKGRHRKSPFSCRMGRSPHFRAGDCEALHKGRIFPSPLPLAGVLLGVPLRERAV